MHHAYTRSGIIAIAALLALSAVSVTAAPRAAAAPSVPDYYTITIGKSETWGGQQFTWHHTQYDMPPDGGTHAESAQLNKLATSMMWTKSRYVLQFNRAEIGVQVRLPGTYTPDEWAKIKDTPVTLKTTVSYSMATSAGGEASIALVKFGVYGNYPLKDITSGSASGAASVEKKLTLAQIVQEDPQGSGIYQGQFLIVATINPHSSPPGSAYINAVVANIQLTWPDGTAAS